MPSHESPALRLRTKSQIFRGLVSFRFHQKGICAAADLFFREQFLEDPKKKITQ